MVMKVAITGGHHTSALPVIDLMLKDEVQIIWFGHRHSLKGNKNDSLEYKQIADRKIPFIDLKAGKFYKTYDPIRLAKIPFGFFQALYYLAKERPDVVLSFGGYLAVPVVIAAWVLGIPSITHEQTIVTGYANKLISKFAQKILISHEESRSFFPPEKTVFSGIPLRKALFEVKTDSFVFNDNRPILYITAGKTGSHKINQVVLECLPNLLDRYNIIHQTGDNSVYDDYHVLIRKREDLASQKNLGGYYLRKFVMDDEIGEIFHKADLILSRAGAHTVYEIKTFNLPAVLVPIPWVSHNEQYKNALLLEDLGLGLILEEENLNCANLLTSLRSLQEKPPYKKRTALSEYTGEAAQIIYEQVRKIYEKKKV